MTTDQMDDEKDGAADEQGAREGEAAAQAAGVSLADFEAARREAQEWKERALRGQAEFENARKRMRKEADEAGTRAIARFVKPILDQLDNLERALAAAKPDAFAEFAQGVTMIRENLLAALAGQGIEPIPAEGAFDPALHEAIAEEERDDLPKGHIARVHRTGYRLRDQLVRSAQVVVAKPPKT
jgi:molecular chaperone GrpE